MWKWVLSWSTLVVPNLWKIDFGFSWSWQVLTSYSWTTWTSYPEFETIFSNFYYIDSIRCLTLGWSEVNVLLVSETWSINIVQNNLGLSWDCFPTSKILEVTTAYKWFTNKLSINTVSWLVEKDY